MIPRDGPTEEVDRPRPALTIELRSDGRIRIRRKTALGEYAETIDR